MAENDPEPNDAANALLGAPTGESSLTRDEVENLEFSTKQRSRPVGVSRHEYLKAAPGEATRAIMTIAGLPERRRPWIGIAILLALAAAVVTAWLWLF